MQFFSNYFKPTSLYFIASQFWRAFGPYPSSHKIADVFYGRSLERRKNLEKMHECKGWVTRDWWPKFATGLNIIIGCSSKSMYMSDQAVDHSYVHFLNYSLLWYLAQSQILKVDMGRYEGGRGQKRPKIGDVVYHGWLQRTNKQTNKRYIKLVFTLKVVKIWKSVFVKQLS